MKLDASQRASTSGHMFKLPKKVDELSLQRVLEKFDRVKNVESSLRPKTSNHSYHVEFNTADSAARALAGLEGHMLDGPKLGIFTTSTSRQDAEAARKELSRTDYEPLLQFYLLTEKLQDMTAANMVMDELIQFVAQMTEIPKHAAVSLADNLIADSSPLRLLLRDYWVQQAPNDGIDHFKEDDFPKEFLQDVATELMHLRMGKAKTEVCKRDKCSDKCLYHQHDDEHPGYGAQGTVSLRERAPAK